VTVTNQETVELFEMSAIVSFRNLGLRSTVSAQRRFAGKLSSVEVRMRSFDDVKINYDNILF